MPRKGTGEPVRSDDSKPAIRAEACQRLGVSWKAVVDRSSSPLFGLRSC